MAVPTVTLDFPTPSRLGNTPMGVLSGTVNVSSYDTADPEVTAITGKFRPSGKLRVCCNGLSSNGYAVYWDATTKSFKAFRPTVTVANPTLSPASGTPGTHPLGVVSGGSIVSDAAYTGITGIVQGAVAVAAPTEAGAVNVGTFDFIAVGQLG